MKLTKRMAFLLFFYTVSTIFGQKFIMQPMAFAGEIQFFVLEGPWAAESARYQLWKSKGSDSIDQLELPDGQYLLGMSRKIDQKDSPFIDKTYSYPGPFAKGTSQEMVNTNKDGITIDFNPESATATITILDGIVCWNWQKGIIIVPRTGQKGILVYLLGVDEGNRDPLLPTLRKGEEAELQLTIVEGKPVELRKVFVLKSQQNMRPGETLRSYYKMEPF